MAKVVVIIRIVGGSMRFEQIFIRARIIINVTLFSPFSLLYILSR